MAVKGSEVVGCVVAAVAVAAIAAFGWYRVGVQAEAYKRQGVDISQWELFMGVKPLDRVIHQDK